ncbi:LysR substrate-binding domain-containing protein [Cupriavidus basilensis]|uniref:LysR substrate-binding domain-containing protein n=1 Tax=Cupriavidus basilensis TaxID=68895 RepID=A0ABT6B0F7_9BURK|nr:LysR substrate-binding domain-containing protein [Cupriavidus basilensis]MDF3838224.1 LysR substrate-binding domain-containing protein [Cupriavidus basilensis]
MPTCGFRRSLGTGKSLPFDYRDEHTHGFARLLTKRFLLVLDPQLAEQLGKRPTADGLASLPLIAYDEDLPLIRPLWTGMFQFAPTLPAALTIPDLRIIQGLVIKGQGWSVLPDYQCTEALASGRLISITPETSAPTNTSTLCGTRLPCAIHGSCECTTTFSDSSKMVRELSHAPDRGTQSQPITNPRGVSTGHCDAIMTGLT